MKQNYTQLMCAKGYEQEWKNEPYIFTRKAGEECYIVLLTGKPFTAEALKKKRENLEQYYMDQGYIHVYHLCILYWKDGLFPTAVMDVVNDVPNLWFFAEDQSRMYRYEHQPMEFDGLCQMFEALPMVTKGLSVPFISESVPWVTCILIAVNVFCFFFPVLTGQYEKWMDIGCDSWEMVFEQGQVYRLLTSMFLHVDLTHLFNNMFVLFVLGLYLEPALGRIQYSILYICSGLVAGLCSNAVHLLQYSTTPSVGASGAIFGLSGALLAMVLFWKGRIPGISIRRVVIMCIASLHNGFIAVNVDNAAHVGGLIAGFLLVIITNISRKNYT